MSKNTAPAPEGLPQHQTKVVVRGARDRRALYDARLKQFHMTEQQQYRLAGLPDRRSTVRWPGARATYENLSGQERLTLDIDPVGGESEERKETKEPWQWALVEFTVAEPGTGDIELAAFLTVPQTAEQKAMTASSYLPIQGITRDGGWGVPKDPIVSFAGEQGQEIAFVEARGRVMSLRVDLRRFPFATVTIEIRGYVEPYFQTGGDGSGGGTCVSSDYYGYRGRVFGSTPYTVDQIIGAPIGPLRVPTTYASFGVARVLACFPDAASGGSLYSNEGIDRSYTTTFTYGTAYDPELDENVTKWRSFNATPADPNAFILYPAYTVTDEYWAPGFMKRSVIFGQVIDGVATNNPVPDPPAGGASHTILGHNYETFYVPTWKYEAPAPLTITAACSQSSNPWDTYSYRYDAIAYDYSNRWESQVTYPERPPMKELVGDFEIPSMERPSSDLENPTDKFGMPLIGHLKIDTSSGSVSFEPA